MLTLLRHRLRSAAGQSSVEYVGAIAVVVALIGVLIGLAPDIGKQIVDVIGGQIDKILGN